MLMVNLNAWLCNTLGSAIDYQEINELAVERNAILTGVDLETARRMTDQWSVDRDRDLVDPRLVDRRINALTTEPTSDALPAFGCSPAAAHSLTGGHTSGSNVPPWKPQWRSHSAEQNQKSPN